MAGPETSGPPPASSPRPAVEVREVAIGYGGPPIVQGIEFSVAHGEVFLIMGPSGCGKTTLLRALAALLAPQTGEVVVLGRSLRDLARADLQALRRDLGLVFQGGALLSSLSLHDNIALPIRAAFDLPAEVIDEAVRMKLAQVGLLEASDKLPSELSGGMRKRASIARALALDPQLLLFDEPTSGLDPVTAAGLDRLVLELRDALGVTIVAVTHDLDSARAIADRVLLLSPRGRALELGTWGEVRRSDRAEVQRFLARGQRAA